MKYKIRYRVLPLALATVTLVTAMAACKKKANNTDPDAKQQANSQKETEITEYTAPSQVITIETPTGTTSVVTQEGVGEWEDSKPGTTTTPNTGNQSGNQQTGSDQPIQPGSLTIEQYEALSTAQQQAYFQSFPSVDAFYDWLEAAEAARKPDNSVTGDGSLDLGDIVGNK